MTLDWTNNASHPRVRPDDRCLGMTGKHFFHLRKVGWLCAGLGERHIQIIVDKDNEPGLSGEVQNPVKGRIS